MLSGGGRKAQVRHRPCAEHRFDKRDLGQSPFFLSGFYVTGFYVTGLLLRGLGAFRRNLAHIDTYGTFGQPQSAVEPGVVVGAALEAAPVALIQRQVAAAFGTCLQVKLKQESPPRPGPGKAAGAGHVG